MRELPYDGARFPARPAIDNRLLPLVPGTQLVLRGFSSVTGAPLDHQVTFTVTDLTKMIDGVRSLVVYDVDSSEGEVTEAELAFFAQDKGGNVWNLGEYPEEYEEGGFVGAPSTWIAGTQGAEAGLHMLAQPTVGTGSYLQGVAPRIDFLDCARVTADDASVTVKAGQFSGVLVTEETSPLDEEGGSQIKQHAPGVGIVKVDFVGDPEAEVLELVELNVLTDVQLWHARQAAWELDARAYRVSRAYRATEPALRCWWCTHEPPA